MEAVTAGCAAPRIIGCEGVPGAVRSHRTQSMAIGASRLGENPPKVTPPATLPSFGAMPTPAWAGARLSGRRPTRSRVKPRCGWSWPTAAPGKPPRPGGTCRWPRPGWSPTASSARQCPNHVGMAPPPSRLLDAPSLAGITSGTTLTLASAAPMRGSAAAGQRAQPRFWRSNGLAGLGGRGPGAASLPSPPGVIAPDGARRPSCGWLCLRCSARVQPRASPWTRTAGTLDACRCSAVCPGYAIGLAGTRQEGRRAALLRWCSSQMDGCKLA